MARRARRAVLLIRDPIDVMMSLWDYRHFTGELPSSKLYETEGLEDYIGNWLQTGGLVYSWVGNWIDQVTSWLDQIEIPIIVVNYARLREYTTLELRRILRFLDVAVDDERVSGAIEASSIEAMRRDYDEVVSVQTKAGSFLGSSFAKPYALGYRFIGRLHADTKISVLNEAQRRMADAQFGSIWERVCNLSVTSRSI
jgi:hypothetical protein